MDTIYDVGNTVFIEAKVEDIHVDEKGIKYMCAFKNVYGDICKPTVGPEILKKDLPTMMLEKKYILKEPYKCNKKMR